MRLHVRADGAEAVRGNDAEPAGPSKRARQNARRRERQKDKTARLETKKSRERQQSLTDELQARERRSLNASAHVSAILMRVVLAVQGIRPEPVAPVAPLSGFRVVRRSVIDAALPCLGCAGKFVVSPPLHSLHLRWRSAASPPIYSRLTLTQRPSDGVLPRSHVAAAWEPGGCPLAAGTSRTTSTD